MEYNIFVSTNVGKVRTKNGKTITLLNPAEKGEKYAKELHTGKKYTNDGAVKKDKNGNFNTDTIVIWPLPKGETASCYEGTGAKGIANRWLAEMFRKEDDQANDQIHFAVENWVFSDFK